MLMLLFLSVCCSGWAFQSFSTTTSTATSSRATRTTTCTIGTTASLLSAVGPTSQWCRTPASTATMTLWATTRGEQQDQQDKSSNTGDNSGGGSSVLVSTQSDTTTTAALFSAFASLDLRDQYDAVLSSACAKLLDGTAAASDNNNINSNNDADAAAATVETKLNDCQRLLQEMNDSNVPASPRSLMALVDVGALIRLCAKECCAVLC